MPKAKSLTSISFWRPRIIRLQPIKGLPDSVYSRWTLQKNKNEALDVLVYACGNNPSIVWDLVQIIETEEGLLDSVKQDRFGCDEALRVWNMLIEQTRPVFERRVWLEILNGLSVDNSTSGGKYTDIEDDDEFESKCRSIVCRLLNLAITKTIVQENDLVFSELDSTLTFRRAAILFDLVGNSSSGFVVHFPLVVAHIVNDEFKVLPSSLWSNPFDDEALNFRDLYTLALAVRVTTLKPNKDTIKLQDLRPGAQVHVRSEELKSLEIRVPRKMEFVELTNPLTDKVGILVPFGRESRREWDGVVKDGSFLVCASNKTEIDGIAFFENTFMSSCFVEILSMYKIPGIGTGPNPKLHESDIVEAVKQIQQMEKNVAKYLSLSEEDRTTIIYDLCIPSHLHESIKFEYSNLLKPNEVLLLSDENSIRRSLGLCMKPIEDERVDTKRVRLSQI